MTIFIQVINSETLDHKKVNNNNFIKELDDPDAINKDYETEICKTHLSNYAKQINYPIKFTYEFTKHEIENLKEACHVSIITGNWPSIYEEELDEIINRLQNNWIDGEYFIRLDSASLKNGVVELPITNAQDLILGLITSKRILTSFNLGYKKLYFIEFNPEFDPHKEVRVFVRNNKVTGISQYHWYEPSYFNHFSNHQLMLIAKNIIYDVENKLIPLVSNAIQTNDFTVDYLVKGDLTLQIIELNSFGYWLSAGSCLFSWSDDRDILYDKGNEQNVYFRVSV